MNEPTRRPDGRYRVQDVLAVTAFQGKPGEDYPDVPTADGVDVQALTDGDDTPFFVTLRIGEAGAVSGNGHFFDGDFLLDLIRQTVERRATGIMGHMRDEDRGSAFPMPALYWVGAIQRGDYAWGKAYVPPGEVRQFIARRKAQNGMLATSIYGTAEEIEWVEAQQAWKPLGFVLESLDLAPPERAGVPTLATVPYVTAEMNDQPRGGGSQDEGEGEMDKLEVIQALTADDARLLPDVVVAAVVAQSDPARQLAEMQQQIAALRQAVGVEEGGDLAAAVKALADEVATQKQQAVTAKVAALLAEVKVDTARGVVADLVNAAQPATVEDVQRIFDDVMAREHVKALLAQGVKQAMGPRQERPAGTDGKRQYFNIPARS